MLTFFPFFLILTVTFDLDVGPVLHHLYPPIEIPSECKEDIAFSSFPDSSIFETGSEGHSFKLAEFGAQGSPVYGYAHFMQRKDETSKRGYLQRSVVILSHLPFPAMFEEMASILATLHLSHGDPVLESACQSIANWPDPFPGSFDLDFLGHAFRIYLPDTDDELQFDEALATQSPISHISASVPPTNPPLLAIFSSCLSSLWSIWELLMLCEPIFIIGSSPRIVSLAVWWLRDLIRPIPLAGDFRPYITIRDRDYASLINKCHPKPGLVIGATNPAILSVTKDWPNVLSLGWKDNNPTPGKKGNPSRDIGGNVSMSGFLSRTHKRFTSKDRPLLKAWQSAATKGGDLEQIASQELRRHFTTRTSSFLAPLNRYLCSLIPLSTSSCMITASSPKSKPCLKPFSPTDFLTSLKAHGTPLPFRSSARQQEFYERWLRTPAFAVWLTRQKEVVSRVLDGRGVQSPRRTRK